MSVWYTTWSTYGKRGKRGRSGGWAEIDTDGVGSLHVHYEKGDKKCETPKKKKKKKQGVTKKKDLPDWIGGESK